MTFSPFYKKKNIFDPHSSQPFKISRSKIELYCDCPRCFYFETKLGISRPPMLPFTLNNAVDSLLKNEFDSFRKKREPHPLMKIYGINALPFHHPDLEKWRENFKGIQFLDAKHQFLIFGAVDDIWVTPQQELIIVDYKATSKESPITKSEELYPAYKRQMEIYQWLFEKAGFKVFPTGYFVYCNGIKNKEAFKRHLEFSVHVIPYQGSKNWIEPVLDEISLLLKSNTTPREMPNCPYCHYALAISQQLDPALNPETQPQT